jgi:hypothetical protein
MKSIYYSIVFGSLLACGDHRGHAAEAFEAGPGREADLPGGKEADGIRGDFVLRNDKIEALVSQNAPLRRANMSTFYGADGVTPGCLFDLTLRHEANDQLVYFGPMAQRGEVSWVRVVPGQQKDSAAVETVVTAEKNGGIYKRHEYRVRDGEQGLWIITTLRNETAEKRKTNIKDDWTRFNESGEHDGIHWANAVDPADHCGYAYGRISLKEIKDAKPAGGDSIELEPKQEVAWSRFLAVGKSPLEAWSEVNDLQNPGNTGSVSGRVTDEDDKAVAGVEVDWVPMPDKNGGDAKKFIRPIPGYTNDSGDFWAHLPRGKQQLVVRDLGRPEETRTVDVVYSEPRRSPIRVKNATRLKFAITREDGSGVPCKAQILATGDTKPVDLGPVMRAHGCRDQYHSEDGQFTVQVPPGTYHVVVTHGIEFSHHEQDVQLEQGNLVEIKATLKRLVDTTGWISADFHNHSTPSGDNICGTPDRIINLAAENIEFAPTTEHNRIYDWRPTIEKLGLLNEIQTVVGMELTGHAAHLNCFPLTVDPFTQDNGAPVWNADPRISAITLRGWQGEREDRWVQINHPDHAFLFNDRNSDSLADGGFMEVEKFVDGMESENGDRTDLLADSPWRIYKAPGALASKVEYIRPFIWRQLLNLGYRITPIAVADAHTVFGNGVGGWRIYLPSRTDKPSEIDWSGDLVQQAKAGHIVLTTGPFLQVTAAGGKLPGDDVSAPGGVELHVKVQCTDWQDIDRVQVLVNSRPEPSLNFTRKSHPQMFQDGVIKFDQKINVPLKTDAHLIVVATHESMTLKTGYGSSSQSALRPMAYHTPIYVDVDGNGFKANGDTLGFEIPVMKMTPDKVRQKLGLPKEAGAKTDSKVDGK